MTLASFGVFVPSCFLSGEANDQNIVPTIPVEILDERKKVIRVLIVDTQSPFESRNLFTAPIRHLALESNRCRIIFMSLFEIRPFIPVRTGDEVRFAVPIKIAHSGALAPKLVAKLSFLETMEEVIRAGSRTPTGQQGCQNQRRSAADLFL